jgi:hypothetical protein
MVALVLTVDAAELKRTLRGRWLTVDDGSAENEGIGGG